MLELRKAPVSVIAIVNTYLRGLTRNGYRTSASSVDMAKRIGNPLKTRSRWSVTSSRMFISYICNDSHIRLHVVFVQENAIMGRTRGPEEPSVTQEIPVILDYRNIFQQELSKPRTHDVYLDE